MVLDAQEAVTPGGRLAGVPIPVAIVVECVISVMAVLTSSIGAEEAAPTVTGAITVIVPVAVPAPRPPVRGIL